MVSLLVSLLLYACANNNSDKPARQEDSSILKDDTTSQVTTGKLGKDEAILSFASNSILPLIAAKEYAKLAQFIGDDGISFSPYGP